MLVIARPRKNVTALQGDYSKEDMPTSLTVDNINEYFLLVGNVVLNNKLFAFTNSQIFYTEDGNNWSEGIMEVPDNFSISGHCEAYGNGNYVIILTDKTDMLYSTDGITWKNGVFSNSSCSDICYGNGKFISITSDGVFYSTDGITWLNSSAPNVSSYKFIKYGKR